MTFVRINSLPVNFQGKSPAWPPYSPHIARTSLRVLMRRQKQPQENSPMHESTSPIGPVTLLCCQLNCGHCEHGCTCYDDVPPLGG